VDAHKRVEEIKNLHETVRAKIERSNATYQAQANKHRRKVVFQPGDLVWIHLRKERFPTKRKTKLMPRADGPFEVLERINDNAYKVNLPGEYGVSATFNVADLSPYLEDDYLDNLRANSLQQGEDDGGPSMELQDSPKSGKSRAKVKEEVQALLEAAADTPGYTAMRKPGFVIQIANDSGGVSACSDHGQLA